jgi:hypothetical protein
MRRVLCKRRSMAAVCCARFAPPFATPQLLGAGYLSRGEVVCALQTGFWLWQLGERATCDSCVAGALVAFHLPAPGVQRSQCGCGGGSAAITLGQVLNAHVAINPTGMCCVERPWRLAPCRPPALQAPVSTTNHDVTHLRALYAAAAHPQALLTHQPATCCSSTAARLSPSAPCWTPCQTARSSGATRGASWSGSRGPSTPARPCSRQKWYTGQRGRARLWLFAQHLCVPSHPSLLCALHCHITMKGAQ